MLIAFVLASCAQVAHAQCTITVSDLTNVLKLGDMTGALDVADRGAIPGDSVEDTAAIQATLTEVAARGGGVVAITRPGTYDIGNSLAQTMAFPTNGGITYRVALKIKSGVQLYLGEGVVLALKAGSNCAMIGNDNPTTRNSDIALYGPGEIRVSTAQGIDNTGPEYWPGHIVVFVGVDRLYMGGGLRFNLTATTIKYGVEASDITDSVFHQLVFDQHFSDALHLEQVDRVLVDTIMGKPTAGGGDQLVAIGPSNGGTTSYYPEIVGSTDTTARYARNLTVRNVFCNAEYAPIRFFGRVTDTIENVLIDGVHGTVANGTVIGLADDPNGTGELVGCLMRNIRCTNITATPSSGNKQVAVTARNATDITLDGGSLDSGATANVGILMVNQGSASYPVAFTNATWTNGTSTITKTGAFARTVLTPSTVLIVTGGTGVTTGVYRVTSKTSSDAVVVDRSMSGGAPTDVAFIVCNLGEVKINNYNVRDAVIGKLVEVAANLSGYGAAAQRITVNNLTARLGWDGASTFGRIYSTGFADNLALYTSWNNVTLEGAYNGANPPSNVQGWDFGPTTFATYHSIEGLNVFALGSSSIVMRSQSTAGAFVNARDWTIANISGNVVQVTTANAFMRIVGSGRYTAIGTFTPTFCSAADRYVQINWPEFRADAYKVRPNEGDMLTNTNGTAAQVAAGTVRVKATASMSAAGEFSGTPVDPWAVDTVYRRTSTKTANYTIKVGESGTAFNTDGAAGTVTFTLPAATAGQWYSFRNGSVNALQVDANGTETIALPSTGVQGAAGKYLQTTGTNGPTVVIACDKAGQWSVYGFTGTWTAEP